MSSIHLRYALLGLGASLVLLLLLEVTTSWWWYWNWLLATSVVTFVMYGFDKTQAKREGADSKRYLTHDGPYWWFRRGFVRSDRF